MENLSQQIKKACREQGINIQQLAKRPGVNMSTSGLYAALANDSLKVVTLQAIASELNVPVSSFFAATRQMNECEEQIKHLQTQLKDRERIAELSDKMLQKNDQVINYLSEQVNRIKSRYKELQVNFSNIDKIYEEDLDDGKKKTAAEKKLKMLREELQELRMKVNAILSE
jgi:transcriptional regulator with XRE-family HTH domain